MAAFTAVTVVLPTTRWAMDRTPGYHALREGRHSQPGVVYHVTFATIDRRPWFQDPALARAACRTFEPSVTAAGARLLAWVLMPDHFHALLLLGHAQSLSRCVQRLKGRATAACRLTRIETTRFWAPGFYDRALRREDDLLTVARYLVANPVRARLVGNTLQYPYWDADWL